MDAVDPPMQSARRLQPVAADIALAGALFLIGSFELLRSTDPGLRSHRPAGLALLLLAALGVAVRRKAPWAGLAAVLASSWISLVTQVPYAIGGAAFLCVMVVLYAVAEQVSPGASALALAAAMATDALVQRIVYQVSLPYEIQAGFAYLVLAWVAGYAQRRRRIASIHLERRAVEISQERERLASVAVVHERSRIASDLHALVDRGVEGIAAQTQAARVDLAAQHDLRADTLDRIEATGRSTLVEMRRLVSLPQAEPGRLKTYQDKITRLYFQLWDSRY